MENRLTKDSTFYVALAISSVFFLLFYTILSACRKGRDEQHIYITEYWDSKFKFKFFSNCKKKSTQIRWKCFLFCNLQLKRSQKILQNLTMCLKYLLIEKIHENFSNCSTTEFFLFHYWEFDKETYTKIIISNKILIKLLICICKLL